MTLGETVVAIFWLGVLSHSLVDRRLHVKARDVRARNLEVLWKTKLFLKLLKNFKVSVMLVSSPRPWLLLFLFEVLDLPECSLHVHNIGRDTVKVTVVRVVVRRVDVVIILAVPGNIIEWVLHFADHVIGILIALSLAVSIARLLKLLNLNQVDNFGHPVINLGEQVAICSKSYLYEVLLPGRAASMLLLRELERLNTIIEQERNNSNAKILHILILLFNFHDLNFIN